jgi:curved DNA-binding protein CbpA
VPKFQAIQAAHEILSDPTQRAKYDADRRKLGQGAGGSRPNPPPRQGQTNFNRSPYEAWSNFPPPRMRTQANPPRERPQSYTAQSSGPSRSANFAPPRQTPPRPPPPPPPPRQTYAKDDADARRNVFTAWEQMKHNRQQDQNWSDDDGLRKARAAKDAAEAHQSKPGLGRSNTTRMPPRKSGFDPAARLSGDWEPAARSTSAYTSAHRSAHPTAPSPPRPTAHGEKPKAKLDPLGTFRSKLSADEVPYSEGTRIRTPYASQGVGQKTYFDTEGLSRSSGMRDAPETIRPATKKGLSPRANAARHRSASPIGRSTNNGPAMRRGSVQPRARKNRPFDLPYSSSDTATSSGDDVGDATSDTSTKPMTGAAAQPNFKARNKAKPGSFWARSDSPPKAQSNGAQTAPESPLNGNAVGTPPMYGNNFLRHPLSNSAQISQIVGRPQNNLHSNRVPIYARRKTTSGFTVPRNINVPRYFHSTYSLQADITKPEVRRKVKQHSNEINEEPVFLSKKFFPSVHAFCRKIG